MTEREQSEFISKATEVFKESKDKVIFIAGQITATGLNVAIGVDTLSTSIANNIYSHNHFLIFGLENVENINALVNALKPLYQPKYPLVLVFDSDEKGLAKQSVKALKRKKVEYVLYPIEIMRKEGIKKSITHIAETLQDNIATKELENINVGKQIKNYLKSIEESASAPAIKT
ncbi:MAG: hypothetical protein LBD56_00745, partial [Endomicrobium sp.]|nr:hypothetical protein [Endomicrobium sp.]